MNVLINSTGREIKALIFDVCGVLFLPKDKAQDKSPLNSFREACRLLGDCGIDVSGSWDRMLEIYQKSSIGELTRDDTIASMAHISGVPGSKIEQAFHDIYRENSYENTELYARVLSLRALGYKIAILSKLFYLSKDIFIPDKYYLDLDTVGVSCDDKVKKPDEGAYTLILERLGVSPNECVFIDDKQENVDAAIKIGMAGIVFIDNGSFDHELENLGILRN